MSKQDTERFKGFCLRTRNMATGRIVPALVAKAKKALNLPDDEPIGRIATITFSAGRYMNSEILRHPDDRKSVDTVIDLDGLNMPILPNGQIYFPTPDAKGNFSVWSMALPGLGPWFEYGKLCLDGSHLMVNWHTQVPAPFVPPPNKVSDTTQACALLYAKLNEYVQANSISTTTQPFEMDAFGKFDNFPATTPAQNDESRTWNEMPPLSIEAIGNCIKIAMPGNSGGAHIFTAHWGQAGVWRALLAPRWNGGASTSLFAGAFSNLFGGGNTTSVDNAAIDDDLASDSRFASGELFHDSSAFPSAVADIDSSGSEVSFKASYSGGEDLDSPAAIQGAINEPGPSNLMKVAALGGGVFVGFMAARALFGGRK